MPGLTGASGASRSDQRCQSAVSSVSSTISSLTLRSPSGPPCFPSNRAANRACQAATSKSCGLYSHNISHSLFLRGSAGSCDPIKPSRNTFSHIGIVCPSSPGLLIEMSGECGRRLSSSLKLSASGTGSKTMPKKRASAALESADLAGKDRSSIFTFPSAIPPCENLDTSAKARPEADPVLQRRRRKASSAVFHLPRYKNDRSFE